MSLYSLRSCLSTQVHALEFSGEAFFCNSLYIITSRIVRRAINQSSDRPRTWRHEVIFFPIATKTEKRARSHPTDTCSTPLAILPPTPSVASRTRDALCRSSIIHFYERFPSLPALDEIPPRVACPRRRPSDLTPIYLPSPALRAVKRRCLLSVTPPPPPHKEQLLTGWLSVIHYLNGEVLEFVNCYFLYLVALA